MKTLVMSLILLNTGIIGCERAAVSASAREKLVVTASAAAEQDKAESPSMPVWVRLLHRGRDGSLAEHFWDKITRCDKSGGYLTISGRKTIVDFQLSRKKDGEEVWIWLSTVEDPHWSTGQYPFTYDGERTDVYPPGTVAELHDGFKPLAEMYEEHRQAGGDSSWTPDDISRDHRWRRYFEPTPIRANSQEERG